MPGASDVCIIEYTLHAFCVRVSREFGERQTHDAKMRYFVLNASYKQKM